MRSFTRTAIQMIIIFTILGSMFLVHTNSRSSILVKEAIYVGGTALALLVAALGIVIDGRIASARLSRSLFVSFILLVLWMLFRHYSGVQSVNASKYMYSTIALGGIVFVMAVSFTEKVRDTILWVLVVSASILSVYAILQSMGIIIFPWDAGLTRMARSSGTMGNANLLGSFSMAMLPVGAGFLLSRFRLSKIRIVSAACFALLCTGAILASKTRGSLIGLFTITVFLFFVPFIRKNMRLFLPLLLVLLILIGGSVILLGSRMEELTSVETGTFQVRRLIWSGTLSMVMNNPILGYGPGSFQIVFPQFRNPEYFLLGVSHNTLHAHCEYLEILGDTGIIGLLLWAAVGYSIFRIVYRKRESNYPRSDSSDTTAKWLVPGIIAGIAALLAEATVSVALRWPVSALLLALFTGLLLASIPCEFTPVKRARRYGLAVFLILAATLLGVVALPEYFRAMRSGKELFRGKDMFLVHIQSGMENTVAAAAEWRNTGDPDAAQRALYYYDNTMHAADSSIAWCEKCVETNHSELGGWYALGSAYISAARLYQQISPPMTNILFMNGMTAEDRQESARYMMLGMAAYDSLTSMAPDYAEVHNNLALVWINTGNPDSALAELRDAWDLHAHNREAYTGKINILNTLTKSMDGVHLHWQIRMQVFHKLLRTYDETFTQTPLFRVLMFDYGTTFIKFEESADSLQVELINMLNSNYPEIVNTMQEFTDLQLQKMQEGLDVLRQFEEGDTAAVRLYLNDLTQSELDVLPIQRALKGRILAAEGDLEGIQIISDILGSFSSNDFSDITAWPMEISQMMDELNEALLRTGLDSDAARRIYLSNEVTLLRFDRRIFEMVIFIESSPTLNDASGGIREELEILWERIGGPLYCFMRLRDDQAGAPVIRESSLLDNAHSGILALEEQDSLNAELVKFEIQWLFVLFSSSYSGIPHYSTIQGARTVTLIDDARGKLVHIIGENETQYQIAGILNDLSASSLLQFSDEFSSYIEALKSDLILGRITRPDLP
ncbi:MAG: O-antigen ligase family protein [Candidatus Aegiribacteria sp.]|nr:O-antigen ligase family protein [Candidatus Aegiribacteria sp.]